MEYVNESELGEDYRNVYQVERDYETGDFYFINYIKRIKYIIVPDLSGDVRLILIIIIIKYLMHMHY